MSAPAGSKAEAAAEALEVIDWGRTRYEDALARQHERVRQRLLGEVPDALVLTEHEPVITLGRGARAENLLSPSVPVVAVERGGDVTWHGPGQVVGYLIRLLPPPSRDLIAHLRHLERIVIDALAAFGIPATSVPERTGVWIERERTMRKIASIGVAARKWCTFHGFALNVDCDLGAFRAINPCGFDASVMTSISEVLGAQPGISAVKDALRASALRRRLPA